MTLGVFKRNRNTMSSFKNILVFVDTHAEKESPIHFATQLALETGAKLKIVDIIPDYSWPVHLLIGGIERTIELATGDKSGRLQALVNSVRDQGVDVSAKLLDGRLSVAMVREAIRDQHDLVIKNAKGRHSRRSGFFGTTATKLFRKCPCPVLATGPGATWPCRRIVAAVDATTDDEVHDKLNSRIIEVAQSVSAETEGQVNVVTAWYVHGELTLKNHMTDQEIEELRKNAKADAEVRLDRLISNCERGVPGDHAHSIHGYAEEALQGFIERDKSDLLVMGTVGRSGLAGLVMGNTAERILDRVQCSVLAIKPDGFTSTID